MMLLGCGLCCCMVYCCLLYCCVLFCTYRLPHGHACGAAKTGNPEESAGQQALICSLGQRPAGSTRVIRNEHAVHMPGCMPGQSTYACPILVYTCCPVCQKHQQARSTRQKVPGSKQFTTTSKQESRVHAPPWRDLSAETRSHATGMHVHLKNQAASHTCKVR